MTSPARDATFERYLAGVTLFALGLRQTVHSGFTTGLLLAVLTCPLWLRDVRRCRNGVLLAVAGLAAAVSGVALGMAAQPEYRVDSAGRIGFLVLLLGTLIGAGVVLWARRVLGVGRLGICYGVGMLAHGVLLPSGTAGNPWKFTWAVPVGVVLLSLAYGRVRAEVVALLVLAGLSVTFDSRSYFATFLITAVLVLWQRRRRRRGSSGAWPVTLALMAGLVALVYYLGTTLLVDGYLGKAAQARTIAQIQTSGSLILGGRPELLATWQLMRHRPEGYGAGVVPGPNDILVAKSGMHSVNYAADNGYVEKYMFGGHIELHSVVGDVWAGTGFAGLVLVALIVALLLVWLARAVATGRADALTGFLALWTLWNVPFSPLLSAAPTLTIALGLILARRRTRTPESSAEPETSAAVPVGA